MDSKAKNVTHIRIVSPPEISLTKLQLTTAGRKPGISKTFRNPKNLQIHDHDCLRDRLISRLSRNS